MCGINGIYIFNKSTVKNGIGNHLKAMNTVLKHRGPDDEGHWINAAGELGLAQTRLSILDLSAAGHQPMKDNLSGNVIAFNGEVFNYRDINDLYLTEEAFYSGTDTETLLKLYRKYDLDMFEKLNGMFAFAIWDQAKEELLLARDHSGKKPLYYTEQNGVFAFSSELKGLFALPWVRKEIDEQALFDFLTYNLVPPPATMFKNIYKFPPGSRMIVNRHGIRSLEPFYRLNRQDLAGISEAAAADMVFETLKKSVEYRMISDVPVGAFLSGGVDSSAVVALMRDNTDNAINTFTIGFADQPDYSELEHAEKVSKVFNTTHHERIVQPDDLLSLIDNIADVYDEPQADTTAIPIYFISELARKQGIKVVLNGDGPDELFSGYNNYLKYARMHSYYMALTRLPGFVKKIGTKTIGWYDKQSPFYELAHRLENGRGLFWPGATSIKESFKSELLSKQFREQEDIVTSYSYVTRLQQEFEAFSGASSDQDFIGWMSFSGYRHADIERFLFRSDRLGMAHSIEARSPFLNREMVALALSLPSSLKVKNGVPKYILKKSLERILPHEVLYRKKMGFCLPIREWAGDTISDYVYQHANSFASNTNYFNGEVIKGLAKQLKGGKVSNTNTVWTFYFLMRWFDRWL